MQKIGAHCFEKLVDPCFHMVPTRHKQDNIIDELQKITRLKVPHNKSMCKDNGMV